MPASWSCAGSSEPFWTMCRASGRLRPHCIPLSNLADSWAKANGMDSHHRAQHARPALPSWDTFLSDPAAWARSLGFTPDIIEQMPEVPGVAPPHARSQEEPQHITWGSLLSGDRSPAQCVAFIDNLITTASAKHGAGLRKTPPQPTSSQASATP